MVLLLDWQAVRPVLIAAAEKLEVEVPRSALPVEQEDPAVIEALARNKVLVQLLAYGTLLETREATCDIR